MNRNAITPPNWRTKTYIQQFDDYSRNSSFTTYKISRKNNNEVDLLARQALAYSLIIAQPFQALIRNMDLSVMSSRL
jgi:hypothetical protein